MRAALALLPVCASVALLSAACAAPARGPLAGESDAWKNAPEPASAAATSMAGPVPLWDVYPEALRWPVANAEPFTSRGHQPEQPVDVHLNDLARPAYLSLVTDTLFPDGAVLVEVSRFLTANSGGFAMRKVGGQWSYFQLDARGGLLESGHLPLCASCHAEAPADHVFGLPRLP